MKKYFDKGKVQEHDASGEQWACPFCYALEHECGIAWNDQTIGVKWPIDGAPVLSVKDRQYKSLAEAEQFI